MFQHLRLYQSYGYKIVLSPLVCSLVAGVLWFLVEGQLAGTIWAVLILGCLFGLSFAGINLIFRIANSLLHIVLLMTAVVSCYVLTLWGGLYFGALLLPIAAGNLAFSTLFFLLDYSFGAKVLRVTWMSLYLLAGLTSTLIIYLIMILEWKLNLWWINYVTYPVVVFVYLQTSLGCRLMARM